MSNEKILGKGRGLLFVISAPAGTGKTTLVKMLLEEFPQDIVKSCSLTTRAARPNEIAHHDYEYISVDRFEALIEQNAFLEHAKVFGHYYGTRLDEVEKKLEMGKHVILVIDTQGAIEVKGKRDAILIFISPPSLESLKARLFKRATEDLQTIERRFEQAKKELSMIPHYDYNLENDNLEISYQILRSIFIAEEHKRR